MPHRNIIEYYGSFVRDNTYNIILEYADRRTLEDYMQNTHEPTSINDIMIFYRRFLSIMHGIVQIHNTLYDDSGEPKTVLGYMSPLAL